MTETPILPGGGVATDDGVDMVPPHDDVDSAEGSGDNRRRLLILGAVAGVIILAAAAYFLLFHKSSSTPTAAVVPHGVFHSAPATTTHHVVKKTTTKTHKAPTSLPKTAKNPTVRDPFLALVTAPVVTTGSAASSTTVTAPTTAPTTGTSPSPSPTTGTGTGTGKSSNAPQWIQLMSIHGRNATFKVGYPHHTFRKFTVEAPSASSDQGTVFAKIFALIAVQAGEATVQIGDGAPFILQEGLAHVA
jgi:hypothetical protein